MSKFNVRVVEVTHLHFTVEADNAEEAKAEALEACVQGAAPYSEGLEHRYADLALEATTVSDDALPAACECDNTHQANDTVCRWCWAHGRRHWNDAEVTP